MQTPPSVYNAKSPLAAQRGAAGLEADLPPQMLELAAAYHSTTHVLSSVGSRAGNALEIPTHAVNFSQQSGVSWQERRKETHPFGTMYGSKIHSTDAASNRKVLSTAQLAPRGRTTPEEQVLISTDRRCYTHLILATAASTEAFLPPAFTLFLVVFCILFVRTRDFVKTRDALKKPEHEVSSSTEDRDVSQTAGVHHGLHAGTCRRLSSHVQTALHINHLKQSSGDWTVIICFNELNDAAVRNIAAVNAIVSSVSFLLETLRISFSIDL